MQINYICIKNIFTYVIYLHKANKNKFEKENLNVKY